LNTRSEILRRERKTGWVRELAQSKSGFDARAGD
jgi:hypothetical protein